MQNIFKNEFLAHQEVIEKSLKTMEDGVINCAEILKECLKNGGKIIICGNGGSAGDAQHFAAELSGRYKKERKALAGLSITTDTSALTAIGNDYGYDEVFARQVQALAQSKDIVFGISTSGKSKNVLKALNEARNIGCKTIGLSGKGGGEMNDECDINLIVPSSDTARIQEIHILIIHILCDLIEKDI